jgi:hypothetical protein
VINAVKLESKTLIQRLPPGGGYLMKVRMSRIKELGEKILKAQADLGLENPMHYRPGLTEANMSEPSLFARLAAHSEFRALYAWRDGVNEKGVPMGKLWLLPGFYFLSSEYASRIQSYLASKIPRWKPSWYPILTNGAAGNYFCELKAEAENIVPVFRYNSESSPVVGQIYDGIEKMLSTLLECYQRRIFRVEDGALAREFPLEVEISRKLNPASDYWRRKDLF